MAITQLFQNLHDYLPIDFSENLITSLDTSQLWLLDFDESGTQIKDILESTYTDGITGLEGVENDGKQITGVFLDKISPTITKRYKFTITTDSISYKLENPDDLDDADFAQVEFAASKMFGGSKKPKKCNLGTACGNGCIKKGLKCSKPPNPEQKKAIAQLLDKPATTKAQKPSSVDIPEAEKEQIALKVGSKKNNSAKNSPSIDSSKSQLKGNEASILTGDNFNKLGINNTAISRFVYSGNRGGNGGSPTPELAKKFIGGDGSVFLDHLGAANTGEGLLGKKVAEAANRHAAEMYRLASDEDKNRLAESKNPKDLELESNKIAGGSVRRAIYKDLLDRKKQIDSEREKEDKSRNKGTYKDEGKDLLGDLLL